MAGVTGPSGPGSAAPKGKANEGPAAQAPAEQQPQPAAVVPQWTPNVSATLPGSLRPVDSLTFQQIEQMWAARPPFNLPKDMSQTLKLVETLSPKSIEAFTSEQIMKLVSMLTPDKTDTNLTGSDTRVPSALAKLLTSSPPHSKDMGVARALYGEAPGSHEFPLAV